MISALARLGARAADVVTVAMMLVIVAEVTARAFFGFSFLVVDEIASYLLCAVTYLGLAETFRQRAFIRIEVVLQSLGGRARHGYDALLDLIGLAFVAVMTVYTARLVLSSFERNVKSATLLALPQYIPQSLIPLGFAMLGLCLAVALQKDLRSLFAARVGRGGDDAS